MTLGTKAPEFEKLLKYSEYFGKALGGIGAITAWIEYSQDQTNANLIKAVSSTAIVFLRINPIINIGIGILDISGVSDKVYNAAGNYIDQKLK